MLFALKPAGLLSQADHTGKPDILTLLKAYLVEKYHKPGDAWLGLVQRLDQPVAGVMVFAKSSKAASRLSEQIRNRSMRKIYAAVCHGTTDAPSGVWQDSLSREKRKGRYYLDSKNGRPASLQYRLIAYDPDYDLSLLQLDLESGRSHQIRLQAASRKLPLLGDRRYGTNTELDRNVPAPCLFAQTLGLIHPVKKSYLEVSAPLPETFPWQLFDQQEKINSL